MTATTDGIGSATAQLTVSTKKTKKHKAKTVKVAAASLALTKTGPVTFEFLLPAKYRKAGAFSVSFATKAPIGAKSWSDSLGVIVKQSPLGKKHSKSHQKGKK